MSGSSLDLHELAASRALPRHLLLNLHFSSDTFLIIYCSFLQCFVVRELVTNLYILNNHSTSYIGNADSRTYRSAAQTTCQNRRFDSGSRTEGDVELQLGECGRPQVKQTSTSPVEHSEVLSKPVSINQEAGMWHTVRKRSKETSKVLSLASTIDSWRSGLGQDRSQRV